MTERRVEPRRLMFGRVAEVYEQMRPSYPRELVDAVISYAELPTGARILDVGAGTGKATQLFAGRGHEIVALEPNAEMAAVASATCAGFPDVTVVEAEFESWELPADPFELVICAQAWHWLDPELRYTKARAALASGGALAAFWNHADWPATSLRAALDEAYRRAAPGFQPTGPMHPLTRSSQMVPDWEQEIAAAPGLERPELRRFPWRERYSAEAYVGLLTTHSDHIMLEPDIRERLLELVREAIEADGGVLEIAYVAYLALARAV